jgi:hypothetical protein
MTDPQRPWLPPSLYRLGFTQQTVGALTYLFLDEILIEIVTVLLHPWPNADRHGRVRFDARDRQVELSAPQREVQRLLYKRLRRRPRTGDAFAARIRSDSLRALTDGAEPPSLADLLDGPVYDLSADAKVVAKLAYYGSVTSVIPAAKADAWGLPAPEADLVPPAGPPGGQR